MENVDQIKPDHESIGTFLDKLKQRQYQIPTFQRDLVWDKDSVKKFWDSIYRFYPIGSILVWKTNTKLAKHREIGGHRLDDDGRDSNFSYILDGQQRTTALLTSIHGVDLDSWEADYEPPLYVDLTVEEAGDVEDSNYKERFLFWNEIDAQGGRIPQNVPRRERFNDGYIVKLQDIKDNREAVERRIHDNGHTDYDDPVRKRLRKISRVLQSYQIPLINLRNIEIDEVTEIFERVNQEGKPLNIFDIVVAKTFRPLDSPEGGFYLREMIEDFKAATEGEFTQIGNLTYLQTLAMIIKYHVGNNDVHNITDTYLPNIRTDHIEEVWDGAVDAFRKTFDFFENHLNLKGPGLIPYRYYYITITFYFYENDEPDFDLLRRYFWYYAFHSEDKLSHTRHLRNDHLNMFYDAKNGEDIELEPFLLDRNDLRNAAYSYRGRFSRAILACMAYHDPKDWEHPERSVLSDVYYQLIDEPNLHHIFPVSFLESYPGEDRYDGDSMMNIAFLRQKTNLEISDDNPVDYLQNYDSGDFEDVLKTHLIPTKILEWSRDDEVGYRNLDEFIDSRVSLFEAEIASALTAPEGESTLGRIEFNATDSGIDQGENVQLLIEEGESQTVEFKSTFRTPVENDHIPQNRIEYQCLKAINGFLNSSEGGKLLIGVRDDGEIHGLEDDYETFNHEEKRDYFEQTLLNRLSSSMEGRFNDFVNVAFYKVDNKDVCLVDVDHASRPAFVEENGDTKFYVRRGNRTAPLSGREQAEYISDNFRDI